MSNTKHSGESPAVRGDIKIGGSENSRLQWRKIPILPLEIRNKVEIRLNVRVRAHAARFRNDTVTDFDVGVSL